MSHRLWVLAVVVGGLLLAGCARAADAPANQGAAAVEQAEDVTADGPSSAHIEHYIIDAEIKPETHTLKARVGVKWRAEAAVSELSFDLRPDLVLVDLRLGEDQTLRYSRDRDGRVTVPLPGPLAAGETTALQMMYAGEINGPRGGASGQRVWDYIGPEGTYVRFEAGWYPQSGSDRATAEICIRPPKGWQVVCSGNPSVEHGATWWEVKQPAAGLSFTAGPYKVTEGKAGETPVICYTFGQHAARAEEFIEGARKLLEVFTRIYGPYPFGAFRIAEIPDLYGGGHGDQGFVMLQSRTFEQPFDAEFVGHEMAHNWWGSWVTCPESEFLAEGFATYSQALYREATDGREGLREAMKRQAEAVLMASGGPDEKSCFTSDSGPLLYEKGAWILHMLRRQVGDEFWFKTVRGLVDNYGGQELYCGQFQGIFEQGSDQDLDWFFDQWLYGTGVPWVRGSIEEAGEGKAVVKLRQDRVVDQGEDEGQVQTEPCSMALLVDVQVKCADGKSLRKALWLRKPTAQYTLEVPGPVEALVVDPNCWLLDHSKGLVGELDRELGGLEEDLQRELGGL